MDGGFAEYVRIPEKAIRQGNVSPLEDEISYSEAALVEPLSCVYNGQMLLNAPKGADTLIIGMGPIGIMHIMMARVFGAGRIFVNDLNADRLKNAAKLIPDVIPLEGDVMSGLHACGAEGVDVCIIAAPAPSAQAQSLEYMNMNGNILYFGGLPAGRENVTINTNLIHYKQLTIRGCTKQSVSEYRLCAKLVNDGRIPLHLIVSDSYRIEQFQEAMDNAAAAKGLKHVFLFD
jgi:L-iditol 2-dehydrogenase